MSKGNGHNGRRHQKHQARRPRLGYCPKCHQRRSLGRHHILPIRFFGRGGKSCPSMTIPICEDCHRKIERLIPYRDEQEREFYFEVIVVFLGLEEVKQEFSRSLPAEQYLLMMVGIINKYSWDPWAVIPFWPELRTWNPRRETTPQAKEPVAIAV